MAQHCNNCCCVLQSTLSSAVCFLCHHAAMLLLLLLLLMMMIVMEKSRRRIRKMKRITGWEKLVQEISATISSITAQMTISAIELDQRSRNALCFMHATRCIYLVLSRLGCQVARRTIFTNLFTLYFKQILALGLVLCLRQTGSWRHYVLNLSVCASQQVNRQSSRSHEAEYTCIHGGLVEAQFSTFLLSSSFSSSEYTQRTEVVVLSRRSRAMFMKCWQ